MKLVKSLLLGSAAGFFAVAGAQAADLPVKKAVAVDYVKVCKTYGNGYFFIPGTDTCIRLSGYVQADYLYLEQEQGRDDFDNLGFRGRGRLNIDVRQPTEYGLLRGFMRLDGRRRTGTFVASGEGVITESGDRTDYDIRFPDQAYIQFGGLTAGRAQSFFDFYTYDDVFTSQLTASDTKTQLLAYTATFGGGLSGTISLEDNLERRVFGGPSGTAPTGFFGGATGVGDVNRFRPEGQEWPDVVANLRYEQAWGMAQISGALHDLSPLNTAAFGPVGTTATRRADDEIGYAINAGVMFKLPFIAPGDELWLQASYADGAGSYAGLPSGTNRFTSIRVNQTDAFVDRFGNTQTTEVFSVAGKFLHYWAPNLRSNFFGGYSDISYDGNASRFVGTGGGQGVFVGFVDTRIWEAGANLIWTPVKQLNIGVEAVYRNFETKGRVADASSGGRFNNAGAFIPVAGRSGREDDVIEARLRVQRDF